MGGNLSGGKRVASGSIQTTTNNFTISGLPFAPKYLHFSGFVNNNPTYDVVSATPITGDGNISVRIKDGSAVTGTVTFNANSVYVTLPFSSPATLYWTVTS